MFKLILNLIYNKASKNRWRLEIGTYLLKKGVGKRIGDKVHVPNGRNGKTEIMYIANLFYDFNKNHIQHSLTKKKPK
jgi:predicted transcriptional regulator